MQKLGAAEIGALLRRVAAKDQAAFRTLYEQFGRRVYAFLVHRFQHESLAEEIVSDTLLHVWNAPQSFRGESAFATWLIGVARFKMLERLRQRSALSEDHGEIDEDLLVEETGPDDVLAMRQRSEGVRECLGALPPEQRECMHLAYYEGWTLEEIAELMTLKKETVGTRLFYARKKIQACLAALLTRERGRHEDRV
ncbi:MAG: sigma-70 family RNA polymerase sigma factor [Burkholderiales bacterium]